MRTPEQIENLRHVLLRMVGPFALLMTDEMVDAWANRFQEGIDIRTKNSPDNIWHVRVRMVGDKDKPWSDIPPEPKALKGPLGYVARAYEKLLWKYPKILEIRLDSNLEVNHVISKKGEIKT